MKRIDTSTRAIDLFGAGKDGYKDGNKGAGIPATDLNASVLNALQEEIANVIEGTGAPLNPADNTQLLQAITNLVKGPADKIVRVASTVAINLNAPGANIDGKAMVAGDTFLEKDNATLANRGIYVWNGAAVPATRDPSADTGAELFGGMIIRVKEGTTNADTNWQVTNDSAVTIGVTGLTFQKVGSETNPVKSGTIIDFGGTTAPIGYLACPLALSYVNATTYSDLAFAIGTTWGNGGASVAAGAFVVGNTYVIKTIGTTDYTLIGAASNTVGLTFKATGAGAGTGTANSEIALPWYPADYASVQANGNVGTNHVGEVISHNHTYPNGGIGGSGAPVLSNGVGSNPGTSFTGGSANRAAGVRVLKCVKY